MADRDVPPLVYPKDAPRGPVFQMVVVPEAEHVQLVNLTPRRHQNVQLWLNQQYGAPIQQINIGADNRYSLRRFINEHGEHVPLAGFLAPDRAAQIVSAEIFDPQTGQRHVLTVRQQTPP